MTQVFTGIHNRSMNRRYLDRLLLHLRSPELTRLANLPRARVDEIEGPITG